MVNERCLTRRAHDPTRLLRHPPALGPARTCDGIVTPLLLLVRMRANMASASCGDWHKPKYCSKQQMTRPVRPLPALQWICTTTTTTTTTAIDGRQAMVAGERTIFLADRAGTNAFTMGPAALAAGKLMRKFLYVVVGYASANGRVASFASFSPSFSARDFPKPNCGDAPSRICQYERRVVPPPR